MSNTGTRRQLVSVPEAAFILGVHPQTIRKHLRDGTIPVRCVRIGRRVGIVRADLDRLVGTLPTASVTPPTPTEAA